MKRLTKKVDGAWTAICEYGNPPYPVVTQDVIDRFAAIEDILGDNYDLESLRKEVNQIRQFDQLCREMSDIRLAMGYKTYEELKAAILSGGLLRLRELAQADREGRCVVLPCKPSDVTVYQLRNKKHARGIGVSPRHISCATVWAGGHYALHHQGQDDCLGRDFKKTWFLDKAEAEAALRREQDGE